MKKLSIIGMPMDLGQMRRGVDMGPSAIRYAGINERLRVLFDEIEDLGDIAVGRPEVKIDPNSNLRNLELVAEKNSLLADEVDKIIFSVRDWFITEELGRGDSGNMVWDRFNDFQAYLYDEVVEKDGHKSTDDVQVSEVIHHMSEWFTQQM